MYLKPVAGIPSGCMLIRIHENGSCDPLYPEVAENSGAEIPEVSPGCSRSLGQMSQAPSEIFCPLEFPSVNGEWKRGWRRWQGLVEGGGLSPEFRVQHQKAAGTR